MYGNSKTMKVAFILGQFPALSETFILNQITGLIDRGYDLDIYAIQPGDVTKIHPDVEEYKLLEKTYYDQRPENKYIAYLNAFRLFVISLFIQPWKRLPVLLRIISSARPGKLSKALDIFYAGISCLKHHQEYDIIHCHFGMLGNKALKLQQVGAIQGKKLITSYYDVDVTKYPKIAGKDVYNELFETGDLFLGLTHSMNKQIIDLGCPPEKLQKLPTISVDLSRYQFRPCILKPDEPIKLLTVARLVETKGIEYSIKAVSQVIEKNPELNILYRIVGTGKLEKKLNKLINTLGVSQQIQLVGGMTQTEVREIYADSHIFILASTTAANGDQEGLPTVLQEAQGIGLPVVSTFHSGIPEGVVNEKSGFLVPERDVDALREKIEYLVKNPQIWEEMSLTGRQFVEANYDMNKIMDQLVELYQKLLS